VRAATTFACVVAARTCERAGASPPRLSELDGEL
jgi:fructokinase